MSEFINIVGFQFKYSDFLLYCDWLLLFSMVFIVYAAYSTGTAREKEEKRDREKAEAVGNIKEKTAAKSSKVTSKSVETTVEKRTSTTPSKKAPAPTTPATTPKKRSARKKAGEEDLGHVMSPEGRRSMRLKTKVDAEE